MSYYIDCEHQKNIGRRYCPFFASILQGPKSSFGDKHILILVVVPNTGLTVVDPEYACHLECVNPYSLPLRCTYTCCVFIALMIPFSVSPKATSVHKQLIHVDAEEIFLTSFFSRICCVAYLSRLDPAIVGGGWGAKSNSRRKMKPMKNIVVYGYVAVL